MEKMNDLKDLLRHEIEDLYSVEEQILEALPAMMDKAKNKTLKNALSTHLKVTKEHKERLDQIKQQLAGGQEASNEKKKGFLSGLFGGSQKCKGMEGIIEEANKIMKEDMTPEVMDAAIIASAQKVEHYEICGYGTARTYASELGLNEVARLLEQTLKEEYEADDQLTALAVQRINLRAGTPATGGDNSASGAARGRSGKETSRHRVMQEEEEAVTVSARKDTRGTRENAKPSHATTPRPASAGRSHASGRSQSVKNGSSRKTAAKKSGGSSARGRK